MAIHADPRNVLLINQAVSYGGSLVLVATLAKHLPQENIRPVLALALCDQQLDDTFREFSHYCCKPAVTYQHHMDLVRRIAHKPSWLRLLALCTFELIRLASTLKYAIDVRRIVRREHISLVHVHHCITSAMICACQGIPFVFHLHGEPGSELRRLGRWAMGKAKHVIAISRFVEQSAITQGINRSQLVVIHNPVTLGVLPQFVSRESLLTTWGVPPGRIIVGHIGRIVPWKGQREFLLAFAKSCHEQANAHALIVGAGDDNIYQQEIVELVATLNLGGRVTFTGHQGNIARCYAVCDIVAHTSVEPEPFGLVITEAMAAGKAVIASSLGAGCEIIEHNVTGLLVDPRDTRKLTQGLDRLLSNQELRIRLGKVAQETVRERFNADSYAQKVANLYTRV